MCLALVHQGGDPTGTGKGGESIWGGSFSDEFHPDATHDCRGILAMANKGANTNRYRLESSSMIITKG